MGGAGRGTAERLGPACWFQRQSTPGGCRKEGNQRQHHFFFLIRGVIMVVSLVEYDAIVLLPGDSVEARRMVAIEMIDRSQKSLEV